jgi:hypothetical protein
MAKACCYYERGKERKTLCTFTLQECPTLNGWDNQGKPIGFWPVEKCDDCLKSAQTSLIMEGAEEVSREEISQVA